MGKAKASQEEVSRTQSNRRLRERFSTNENDDMLPLAIPRFPARRRLISRDDLLPHQISSEFRHASLPGRQLDVGFLYALEDRIGGAARCRRKFPMGYGNHWSRYSEADKQLIDEFPARGPALPRKMVRPIRL